MAYDKKDYPDLSYRDSIPERYLDRSNPHYKEYQAKTGVKNMHQDKLKTAPSSDAYRDGWIRVFGSDEEKAALAERENPKEDENP